MNTKKKDKPIFGTMPISTKFFHIPHTIRWGKWEELNRLAWLESKKTHIKYIWK